MPFRFSHAWKHLFPTIDNNVDEHYLQIAKGKKVRFEELVEKLNNWLKQNSKHLDKSQDYFNPTYGQVNLQKAKELAGQRVRVMPGIRWQVFQRDRWRCVACGRSAADNVVLHVDHIVPRSKGGKDTIENYQTLCNLCNVGKSNKDATDLRNT